MPLGGVFFCFARGGGGTLWASRIRRKTDAKSLKNFSYLCELVERGRWEVVTYLQNSISATAKKTQSCIKSACGPWGSREENQSAGRAGGARKMLPTSNLSDLDFHFFIYQPGSTRSSAESEVSGSHVAPRDDTCSLRKIGTWVWWQFFINRSGGC